MLDGAVAGGLFLAEVGALFAFDATGFAVSPCASPFGAVVWVAFACGIADLAAPVAPFDAVVLLRALDGAADAVFAAVEARDFLEGAASGSDCGAGGVVFALRPRLLSAVGGLGGSA